MKTITFPSNDTDVARRAARHTQMPFARVLRAYLIEAKYEFLRMLKTPAYSFPMLFLPVLLYLLIGVVIVGPQAVAKPEIALYMLAGFVVFAVTGPGMFGFGVGLAVDRQSGVLNLKRAQPMPTAAHIVARMLMALTCACIVLCLIIPLATAYGHVSLTASQSAAIVAVGMLGILTFCAIGLFIGAVVSGSAATGIVNLIYFPMMYLSGMFFPLPKSLAPWALIWPTFYLDQLVMAAGGGKSYVDPKMCAAVLVGLTVLFGGLAIRRLARVG